MGYNTERKIVTNNVVTLIPETYPPNAVSSNNNSSGPSATYLYQQQVASAQWNINHNLNKYPNVIIIDTAGSLVMGDVKYLDMNNIQLNFSVSFSGEASLS